ncbi:hypothetical protein THRCLA_22979, partial [Thraustotheca clavata]
MPKVSPSMSVGRITAWKKNVGDYVECYDLLFEFDAKGVTDDDVSSATQMELECCDEGYLALVVDSIPDGKLIAPGAPVALLCDSKEEMNDIQTKFTNAKDIKNAVGDAQVMAWHAYL